jgi:hypothetical protein
MWKPPTNNQFLTVPTQFSFLGIYLIYRHEDQVGEVDGFFAQAKKVTALSIQ